MDAIPSARTRNISIQNYDKKSDNKPKIVTPAKSVGKLSKKSKKKKSKHNWSNKLDPEP
jgi:hypothetical protein